jgi:xylulokinase
VDPVTIGVDVGTTSVKAVAVDPAGSVRARARVPHRLIVPAPDRMEHDAKKAWRNGPLRALAALGGIDAAAIGLTAMVPSMTAVDSRGRPLTPGLLYGDGRGRIAEVASRAGEGGEPGGFLRWSARAAPEAAGFWPAQAVASCALGGAPAIDAAVAASFAPLYGPAGWDSDLCHRCGVSATQLPSVEAPGAPVGRFGGDGPLVSAGSVDVWCEQMVAGAGRDGDVHVICGTTLIVWAVARGEPQVPGLWTVPHRIPGRSLVGGASNAGGLFVDWASRFLRGNGSHGQEPYGPSGLPVWVPYPRGERTPYHDSDRRASLHGLDLTHGPPEVTRAAWEATGFVVRHHLDLAGIRPARIVATGGGTRSAGWMQALADTTATPVHVAADPEGAARGAAYLARIAAGLEEDLGGADGWARTARVVEPQPRWVEPAAERYASFLELSG